MKLLYIRYNINKIDVAAWQQIFPSNVDKSKERVI